MNKNKLKTPLTWYGGKQKLASTIINLIPPHTLYCEPFLGGAAIFFAKPPSPVEVLNDTNKELINFYKVVQNKFLELEKMIRITLHSRTCYEDAQVIYNYPHLFDEIDRAWAVWVLSSQGFSSILDSSWGYDKSSNTTTKKIVNNKDRFTEELAIRLQNVQLECADALYIVKSRDSEQALFYCDPPYFNSDCRGYKGYTEQDFENLLISLSNIKGKFILSSYPSPLLERYTRAHKWYTTSIAQKVSVGTKATRTKGKIEVITINFQAA